ncbi:MAG: ATP-binding protein [Thermoplasmatota archaeon]
MKDVIHDWNPWWNSNDQIRSLKGVDRGAYLDGLKDLLPKRHIISLPGIRRSGKTTIMYQLIEHLLKDNPPENICYMNMDDERLAGLDDPLETFLKEYRRNMTPEGRVYLFLDEIQSIHDWERWLKRYYDLGKDMKFVISGSFSSLLSSDYSHLLTGRNISMKIDPLSFGEYLSFKGLDMRYGDNDIIWRVHRDDEDLLIHHLEAYMKTGGFPEVVRSEEGPDLLKQYFNDILYRDIIKRHHIRFPEKLELLAVYSLRNHSNIMSLRRIGKASGLSPDTVNEYMYYLEQAFLIFRSRLYSRSTLEGTRTNLPMKIYSTDLGMANSLMLEPMDTFGRWAENLLAKKVEKELGHCFYWREKREVDILIPDHRIAMQVNYGRPRENEISAFGDMPYRDFEKVLVTRDQYSTDKDVKKVPLWVRLLSDGWRT